MEDFKDVFKDAPIFDLPDATEDDFPTASADTPATPAVTDSDVPAGELVCEVCGTPLEYAGRGRKPKFCAEHKAGGNKSSSTNPKAPAKRNDALAQDAADTLSQLNGLIAVALSLPIPGSPMFLPETAKAINDKDDKFNQAAADALRTNPTLARSIARAGGVSGSAGLVIAYGVFIAGIAPVAMGEIKAKRATQDGEG